MGAGPSFLGAKNDKTTCNQITSNKKICTSHQNVGASLPVGQGFCRYCTNNNPSVDFFLLECTLTTCCDACTFGLEPHLRLRRSTDYRALSLFPGAGRGGGLSLLSIFEYLRVVSYCEGDCQNNCAVCCDEFEDDMDLLLFPCGHYFHKNCILPWLVNERSCPSCRYEIPQIRSELGTTLRLLMSYTFRELREGEKFLAFVLAKDSWDDRTPEGVCSHSNVLMPIMKTSAKKSQWEVKAEAASKVKDLLSWSLN